MAWEEKRKSGGRLQEVMSTARCLRVLVVCAVFTTVLFFVSLSLTIYVVGFMDFSPKKAGGSGGSGSAESNLSAATDAGAVTTMGTTTASLSTGDSGMASTQRGSTIDGSGTTGVTTEQPDLGSVCMRRGRSYVAYIGPRSVSASGATCLMWQDMLVYETLLLIVDIHILPDISFEEAGNKCRNPNDDTTGPWCFVMTGGELGIETCDITTCTEAVFEPCYPNPCDNGGTCVEEEGEVAGNHTVTCLCAPGYGDRFCTSRCADPEVRGPIAVYDSQYDFHGYPCINNTLLRDLEVSVDHHCFELLSGHLHNKYCERFQHGIPTAYFCHVCASNETDCRTEGLPYSGSTNIAASENLCLSWSSLFPRDDVKYRTDISLFPDADYSSLSSYCRNPTNDPDGPYCFALIEDENIDVVTCDIPFCEIEGPVDYCLSNPCLHGGTCSSGADQNYQCDCAEGYIGRRCEAARSECKRPDEPFTGRVDKTKLGRQCIRWEWMSYAIADFISLDDLPDSTWDEAGANCRELNTGVASYPTCIAFNDDGDLYYASCTFVECSEFQCKRRIISESETLPDISTSSELNSNADGSRSRLDTQVDGELSGGWVAGVNNENQWIQVELDPTMILEAVLTQGRREADQWVTQFTLEYKVYSGDAWRPVYNADGNEVFFGNTNRNGIKENRFSEALVTRLIRLKPLLWNQGIALRWELIGCDTLVGKTAHQSDFETLELPASLAIDGNVDQVMSAGSCVTTTTGANRWWSVDLGQLSVVHSLIVFPRLSTDGCETCLRSFNVWIMEDHASPLEAEEKQLCIFRTNPIPSTADYNGYWLTCSESIVGRYVAIQEQDINEAVTFCEVLVRYYEQDTTTRDCTDFRLPYTGTMAVTQSGRYCDDWSVLNRQVATQRVLDQFEGAESWGELRNQCRDPQNTFFPSCPGMVDEFSYYLELCDVPVCSTIAGFDLCEPNPCMNGATCVPEQYEGDIGFSCACAPGFNGLKCETGECMLADEGREYAGNLATTIFGVPCTLWTNGAEVWEQFAGLVLEDNFPDASWEELANKCRFASADYLFCLAYTNAELRIATCSLPHCPVTGDCQDSPLTYDGSRDVTATGKPCIPWHDVFTVTGSYLQFESDFIILGYPRISDMLEVDLLDMSNKCRNPDEDPNGPWCYAADMMLTGRNALVVRPLYCDIPACRGQ